MADNFRFGRPLKHAVACCTKPVGCAITDEGCLFLRHPWKRANVFHDPTVRCQAKGYGPEPDPDHPGRLLERQCALLHGHEGAHDG